jgi:periplasmic copper chaperone A
MFSRFVLLCLTIQGIAGHVSPTIASGLSGGSLTTGFRISHGCDGADTTSVVMTMPDGVVNVKAAQLPGYEITTTTRVVEPPVEVYGTPVNETVDTITWNGTLPSEQFQYFTISMQLPTVETETSLKFNTIQYCADGAKNEWVGNSDADTPAPVVTVTLEDTTGEESAADSKDAMVSQFNLSLKLLLGILFALLM